MNRAAPPALVAAGISGVALLVLLAIYFPGLDGPWVLDDKIHLQPPIEAGEPAAILEGGLGGALGRPLTSRVLWLERKLAGASTTPRVHKAAGVAWHMATAALVLLLLCQLNRLLAPPQKLPLLLLVGATALWALHPLLVSTVLYPVQRGVQLCAILSLVAAILYLRLADLRAPAKSVACSLTILGVAALAILAKETGALIPLLLLVLMSVSARSRDGWSGWSQTLCIWAPLTVGVVGAIAGFATLTAGYADRPFTLGERISTEFSVLLSYVEAAFLPVPGHLALYQDRDWLALTGSTRWWLGVTLIPLSMAAAIRWRQRYPWIAFGVLWFFACHALESTFLPLELAFEHRNYLALLGPVVGTVSLLGSAARHGSKWPLALIAVMAVGLGLLTLQRTTQWSSLDRFLLAQRLHQPESPRARSDFILYLAQHQAIAAARRELELFYADHPRAGLAAITELSVWCYQRAAIPGDVQTRINEAIGRDEHRLFTARAWFLLAQARERGACPALNQPAFDAALEAGLEATAMDRWSVRRHWAFWAAVQASQRGDHDRAQAWLEEWPATEQDPEFLFTAAMIQLRASAPCAAEPILQRLARLAPTFETDAVAEMQAAATLCRK